MNYIKWNLDTEDGIDIVDPMGNLYIIGDKGEIVEKFTNLDTFFEALAEAAQSIKIGKSTVVDPIFEPNNIHFKLQKKILKITYGEQTATVLNADGFIKDVGQAVEKLLKILDDQSKLQKQPKRKLTRLRKYLTVKA